MSSTHADAASSRAVTNEKDHRLLVVYGLIALACIVSMLGAWHGANWFGDRMATLHAERQAQAWAERAVRLLEHKDKAFAEGKLSPADKAALAGFLKSTDIYRYKLFSPDGLVFWSSKASNIGKTETRAYFRDFVMKGKIYTKHAVNKASDIDGLLQSRDGRGLSPDEPREITEIYVPVAGANRFNGAMEVYADASPLLAWYKDLTRQAAFIICAVVLLMLLSIGGLIALYANERVAREQRIRKMADDLAGARDAAVKSEQEARGMADNLRQAHEELKQNQQKLIQAERMTTLGQLTATVSHELRNPLSALRNSLYTVKRMADKKNINVERPMERAERSISRCDNIIGDLLEYTRVNELKLVTVDSSDYLSELLNEQTVGKGVELSYHFDQPGPEIGVDIDRFRRVIINLVENASQAITEAGISQGQIRVTCEETDDGPVIKVTDNGPGIPEDVLGKIFDPLFTTKSFGAGLGLPTVKQIIERHGAELRIETEVGKGTTFSVHLPAANAVPQIEMKEDAA